MPKFVFISQPMAGKSTEQIHDSRVKAIQELKKFLKDEELIIIDSFVHEKPSEDNPAVGLWYLAESLKIMSHADIVYFAEGYENARGCLIEEQCAIKYNKVVLYQRSNKRTAPRLISEGR